MPSEREVWNSAADPWTTFVRDGKDYFREYMNTPGLLQLLGDISGQRVLDLGCGEGYNTRLIASLGAGSVVGVDVSDKMVKLAQEKEDEDKLGITYMVMNGSDMQLFEDGSFDVVAAFMVIMDVEDYESLFREVGRVLKKDGRFIFSITHPCFELKDQEGGQVGGWIYPEGERHQDKALYFSVDKYFDSGKPEKVPWNMERIDTPFETVSYHRTLTEYTHALTEAEMVISRLLEPKPTEEGLEKHPWMKTCLRVPHSIIFEAIKR